MKTKVLAMASAVVMAAGAAQAADEVRVGMITTLSGGGSGLGIDIRDGFMLGLEHVGGKLGGLDTVVTEGDDQRKPDVAKQLAERMIEREDVDIITGTVWSNLALALMPTMARNEVIYLSPNAGPSVLAGAQCNEFFFNVAWQNDNNHEAMGQYVQDQGFQNVYILAPNYPAGRDALTGFKRYYTGNIAGEVYTELGQLDYAAELAQLRAASPDAVFFFLPGGMGINFVKQYDQAGLKGDVPLFGPAFSFSQDILAAVGDAALGVMNTAQWSPDLDNAANQRFVADFQAAYGRIPSLYASQGYDAALLIDAAVRQVDGDIEDGEAFRAALQSANFDSVRGGFQFNRNHFPVQDFYLRQVTKDGEGRLTNTLVGTVFTNHSDAYADDCSM